MATSSSPRVRRIARSLRIVGGRGPFRGVRALLRAGALALALVLAFAEPVAAKIFASQKQALAEAFPEATRIERKTLLLRKADVAEIEKRIGMRVDAKVVVIHVAHQKLAQGEKLLGFAEIAVHTVRTQPEAMLIVLTPEGRVRSVRIIAFHEPLDYLPTDRWYAQFAGKGKGDGLGLGREIHGVVGATLSARAAVDGVRKMLAYWDVLLRPAYASGAEP